MQTRLPCGHCFPATALAAGLLAALAFATAGCDTDDNVPLMTVDSGDNATDPGTGGDNANPGDTATPDGEDRDDTTNPDDPGQPIDPGQDPGKDPGANDPGHPTDTAIDAVQCVDSSTCPLGNICWDRQCVPGCGSDRDCPQGTHCKADALPHGFCAQCLADDHCDTADGEKCVGGTCIATCGTNDDCAGKTGTPYCDIESGLCVACLADGACPIGSLCIANRCLPGCRSDRDCGEGLKCDPKAGEHGGCFVCVRDADCGARVCRDHQCVVDCSVVKCPVNAPVCDPATGACVQCLQKSDCGTGYLCLGNACIAGCETDNDCTGGRKCNNGTCVQCLIDDHCPDGQKCLQNQCLSSECARDTDCGSGRYCHPLLASCETLPAGYCNTNADCTSILPFTSEVCDALTRTCIPACMDLGGLPICLDLLGGSGRTVCVNGGCYFCGSNGDCPGTLCDPFDRSCRVCTKDADCSVPTWHCDTAGGACYECLNDGQCAFPQVCDEAGGHRCVECLVDEDCRTVGKPICGKSKTCIAPCVDECSSGQKICNPDDTVAPIGTLSCGDYDDDPCREYGGSAECGTGASCVTQAGGLGQCVCQNACSSGQKRCPPDGEDDEYETCAQNSSSGCWYWSAGYCGSGEICSSGSCVCGNICTVGQKACSKNDPMATLICDDYDYYDPYNTCPYWQYGTSCQTGYVCTGAGVCTKQ